MMFFQTYSTLPKTLNQELLIIQNTWIPVIYCQTVNGRSIYTTVQNKKMYITLEEIPSI